MAPGASSPEAAIHVIRHRQIPSNAHAEAWTRYNERRIGHAQGPSKQKLLKTGSTGL